MPQPYPLIFEPILMDKVWGGDRLRAFGKKVDEGAKVGESWELADLAKTSASGAGGGAQRSEIRNGPLAGKDIHFAIGLWADKLLGRRNRGGFPLLIKFLDARENLSVQVHPSQAYAASHPDAHLKTECWYVLSAEPGAKIYKGVRVGVTPDSFKSRIASGEVKDDLEAVDAVAGECHVLPSGTVHALGAGVLVAEVQTPSDTTFRVFDWGRSGRELHIDQAMECIEFARAPEATRFDPSSGDRTRLVKTPFFSLDEARPSAGKSMDLVAHGEGHAIAHGPLVVMVLAGSGTIEALPARARFESVPVTMGETVLIPAALSNGTKFTASVDATILIASVC
ncbi:MAG: type I phosphomannose isomerase catalytic subunit [Phycisphaerales bacterium]